MYPGSPSPYPRNSPGAKPAGEVSLDAIGRAWNIVTQNLGPYALCCFLAGIPVLGSYFIAIILMVPLMEAETLSATFLGMGIFLSVIIAGMTVTSVITAGMVAMTLKALRGETPEISDISKGFVSNPLGLIVAALICSVAVNVGSYLCYIPGFVIGGLWMLTAPMMLDKKLGPIDALKESFRWMQPHWIMAGVLFFLITMVSGLGAIACGIGILVTMPMYFAVTAIVYEDLRKAQSQFEGLQGNPEVPAGFVSDPFVSYTPTPRELAEEASRSSVEPPPVPENGFEPEKPPTEPPIGPPQN